MSWPSYQSIYEMKIKHRFFKSSEHINEKGDGPYNGFCYLSLFSDPVIWQHGAKENYSVIPRFDVQLGGRKS